MKKNIIAELRLDRVLLIIRMGIIIIWLGTLWNSVKLDFFIQLLFTVIIFLSDALDGMISRRFCAPLEQYRFRILDATVDKVGILGFLLTLFCLGRSSYNTIFAIIGYNILLVVFPLMYMWRGLSKNVAWIQATGVSRFYAMSVGLYCFFALVNDTSLELEYERVWFVYFFVLGIIALTSHVIKINNIKNKGVS